MSLEKVVSIILAGGKGSRLGVLTMPRSKPAVGFAGHLRMIDWPMSNNQRSKITDVYYLTQFESESLAEHIGIGDTWGYNGDDRRVINLHPQERTGEKNIIKVFQGTADAPRVTLPRILRDTQAELFLILSGDHIYSEDYRNIIQSHISSKADLSIYTKAVTAEQALGFGIMKVNKACRITDFKEKPGYHEQEPFMISPEQMSDMDISCKDNKLLASMGIYLFNKDALEDALATGGNDFGGEIIPGMIKDYNVNSHMFTGYWKDVGTLKAFYEANMELASDTALYQEVTHQIKTHLRNMGSPIIKGAVKKGSIISLGCVVEEGARVSHSVFGYKVFVRKGAEVVDSVLLGASRDRIRNGVVEINNYLEVGEGSYINHAILDKNVHIGKNVEICREDIPADERIKRLEKIEYAPGIYLRNEIDFNVRDNLVVLAKGIHIPDNMKI